MKQKIPEIDIALLERNLALTPEQRLIEHQKALDLFWELQKTKIIKNEKDLIKVKENLNRDKDKSILKELYALKNSKSDNP